MEEEVTYLEQEPQQDDPPKKYKVKEFAAKIKAKYPAYKDIDDKILTDKIIAKYPQYKDQVDYGTEIKKKVGSIVVGDSYSTPTLDSETPSSTPESQIPTVTDYGNGELVQDNIFSISKQYNKFKGATKVVEGLGDRGTEKVVADEDTRNAASIMKADFERKGIDIDAVYSETKDLTGEDIAKYGAELTKERVENFPLYQRKVARLNWKRGLDNELNSALADGRLTPETYDNLQFSINSSLANSSVGDFKQQRENVNSVANAIKQFGGANSSKLLKDYAVEISKVYGNAYNNNFDKAAAETPESKYLTTPEAQLGYQYIKDLSPEQAEQYKRLFIDPKELKDKVFEQKGYNHLMQTLEETGIGLQENAVKEELNNLNNIAKRNGGLTPEQIEQATKLENKAAELSQKKSELDRKYPDRIEDKVDDATQEILGQRLGWGNYAGGMAGKAFKNTIEGVWEAVSTPFMSDESNRMRELAIMGETLDENRIYHTTDKNKSVLTDTLVIKPELQLQIDAITNDKTLSREQKENKLYPLLKENTDKFGRVPVQGGKFNISPSSILYGLTDLGTTLLPFVALEAATGGIGGAGAAGKFLRTFTAAAATSFHDTYAGAIMEGKSESDAYKQAMGVTAIMSAAMAGAGTPDAIRAMIGAKTSAAKVISGYSDEAIQKILDKGGSKVMNALKDRMQATPKLFAKGLETGAKFEVAINLGEEAKHQIYNTEIDREQNFKRSIIGVANFGVLGAGLGHIGYKSPTQLQKSGGLYLGKNSKESLVVAQEMRKDGQLTQPEYEHRVELIEKFGEAYKTIPKANDKGKPLTEKQKAEYIYNTVIKNDGNKAKSELPPQQAAKAEHTALTASYANGILLSQPGVEKLTSRKNALEKSLEPKTDAKGQKTELPEKEKKEYEAELQAVNDAIQKVKSETVSTQLKPEDIHASAKLAEIDYESEGFRKKSKELTGKEHLDDMNAGELGVMNDYISTEKLIKDYKEKNPIYKDADSDVLLKEISEQAQSIAGGQVDKNSTPEKSYANAVKLYGSAELVDAAITKYPKEKLLNENKASSTVVDVKDEKVVVKAEPKEYLSKTGRNKIVYENGNRKVIDVKSGEEVSAPTARKVLREAQESYDYTVGKKATTEVPEFTDNKEHAKWVVENSENPAEIAIVFRNEEKEGQSLNTVEEMILDYGISGVKPESYYEFGDRNNMTNSKARAYLSRDKSKTYDTRRTLDVIAKEISDHYDHEVTPQDLVAFMDRFYNGAEGAAKLRDSEASINAQVKFEKLTGLPLNDKTADIAINQEFKKLSKQQQELLNNDYETRQQLEDAYWQAHAETNGFTKESVNIEIKQTETKTNVNEQTKANEVPVPQEKGGITNAEPNKVIEQTETGEGGKEPPKEEPVSSGKGGGKDKGVLNHLVEAENIPEEARKGFIEKGLKYEPKSWEESAVIGKSIVEKLGIEEAVLQAEATRFKGGVNSAIFAESLNRLYTAEKNAKTPAEANEIAKQFEDISIRLDEWAREGGRDISQIGYFYKKSPLGITLKENTKRRADFDNWAKPKEKSWKEFFDEMMKEPEFDAVVKEQVSEAMKQERAEARKNRIKKVDDAIDAAIGKFKGGAAYSTIIPPQVITTALEGIKKAYHAGEKVAKIIEDAVDYISKELKGASWDKDKFRKEWGEKLKEPEKRKLTDEEVKAKILDKFRNKLKGLSDSQRNDIIRKSFKQIVENGGLDYADFRKIIAEVTGRTELTDAEAASLRELVQKTNEIEDAAQIARTERTPEALRKFRQTELEAGKASQQLSEILDTKPNIARRLTSILQLNTLGIPALVNNPIYNVWNQLGVRLPVSVFNSLLDQGIKYTGKLFGKKYNPETNIIASQKEFFKKLGLGTKEAGTQFFTGLNRMDYTQKEIYGQQIRPARSIIDIGKFFANKKNLTKSQFIDKVLQGTVGAPAEVVARVLNLGDKPLRFGAEGAQAAVFAKNLGLKGMDYNLFIEFPREEAYRNYKEQGLSDAEAGKKADYIKDIIIKEGQRATFQQDNFLNDKLNQLFGGASSGVGGLGKSVLVSPYIKIPANAYWSYYNLINPEVALLQATVYGAKAYAKRNKGDNSAAKDLHEGRYWLAHAAVGMATRAVIASLVSAGIFRSANTQDDTKKEREGESFYEQQGTFNVSKFQEWIRGGNPDNVKDGLVIQNRWGGQFGTMGNAIARKNEEITPEQKEKQDEALNIMFGGMELDALKDLQQGVFANTSALLGALNGGPGGFQRYGVNTLNMFTNIVHPATFAQISRAQLPYYNKAKADSFYDEVKNSMLSRSSVLRKLTGNMPHSKIGIWGDRLDKKDNVIMRLFGMSRNNKDNFAQPIYEDAKRTNNIGFFPPSIKPEIRVDGESVKLNQKESTELEMMVGRNRRELAAPFINGEATYDGYKYSELPNDEAKLAALRIIYDLGREAGEDEFVQKYPQYENQQEYKSEERLKMEQDNKAFKELMKSLK